MQVQRVSNNLVLRTDRFPGDVEALNSRQLSISALPRSVLGELFVTEMVQKTAGIYDIGRARSA